MLDTENCLQNHIKKMLKQQNLFYNQPSTLPKEALAKFYLSTTFGLIFMIRSVAPTRSANFYGYLITKIGKRNLNSIHFEIKWSRMARKCLELLLKTYKDKFELL